jgi:thiol-disulfide isomerase/thioredoxin
MLTVLACLAALSSQPSSQKALQIIRDMGEALKSVEAIELDIAGEMPFRDTQFRAHAVAALNPIRYWSKLEMSNGTVEYASLDGLTMHYTDEKGQRVSRQVSTHRIAVNDANGYGYHTWRIFLERDRFSQANAENCIYLHAEEVEGRTCDLVGQVKSTDDGELITTTTYYWVDREQKLPRATQLHSIIRGKSNLSPKWVFSNLRLNPDLKKDFFAHIPDGVAAVQPQRSGASAPSELVQLEAGAECPDVSLDTMEFERVSLKSQIAGQTLVTYWAPWCGPCIAELDALKELAEVKSGQLQVIAIGVFDSKQNILKYAREKQIQFKVLVDPDAERTSSSLARAFGLSAIPHAFLFGSDRKLIRHWIGFGTKEDLEKKIRSG